jgi:AraC family transcriptional regulator of adaptative response/methylated-DNA-[protein]-cysteine methyltransferase
MLDLQSDDPRNAGSMPPKVASSDFARIERAIRYLQSRANEQPSLAEVAAELELSEFHFQRLFQRWAGVSPKRFLQFITLEHAKRLLDETRSVLETSVAVGLSGPSRLHDLFLNLELLTPGEYKSGAQGLTVFWGIHETPFGPAIFAAMERGLCGLSFLQDGEHEAFDELARRWPGAKLEHRPAAVAMYARELRARLQGKRDQPLSMVLKGTPLQLKVWEALLRIPEGGVAAYKDVARLAGVPGAVRAVGTAIGQNPIACLIPCHRVIASTGAFGGYHWGAPRKVALLGMEMSHAGA